MRKQIPVGGLRLNPFNTLAEDWMLLTAGDFASGEFNSMTVAWGALGTMWSRPLAVIVVRPTRHTYKFTEEYGDFTLSVFPEKHRDALKYMGSVSGRDEDKVAGSGLTPEASSVVAAPSFREAELVIECRKSYFNDMAPENFLAPYIAELYKDDYHRIYFGEVLGVSGTDKYSE